jgi:hypothetical protein
LYKIHKNITVDQIFVRGYNLTKKLNKRQTMHSLVFLRPPKHFNIGKHKVLSFKNKKTHRYVVNLNIPFISIVKYPLFLYNMVLHFHKFHILHTIVSIKINAKIKINFN